jgi:hypothetical protein
MGVGLSAYEDRYADSDVLVFEPRRDDYDMFFSNVFTFSNRKAVCEHAYQSIRLKLARNRDRIAPILERHGLRLRTEILDEERDLWESVDLYGRRRGPTSHIKDRLDKALAQIEAMVNEG